MKTVFEHIETVKSQPHHIRRRITFTVATVGAGVIAFVWLAGSLATGAFAVRDASFADATNQEAGAAAPSTAASANLAGAAAAVEAANAPAHIEIIDATPAQAVKKPEQTTIPF